VRGVVVELVVSRAGVVVGVRQSSGCVAMCRRVLQRVGCVGGTCSCVCEVWL